MPPRSSAAEFPHDNPALWLRPHVPTPAPRAPEAAPSPEPMPAPESTLSPEPEPVPAPVPAHVASSPAAPAPARLATSDDHVRLFAILADVALQSGMTRAAALLASDDSIMSALPADLARSAAAWRDVLAGTSDDYAACGDLPLDEWAASVLATLAGAPERAIELRRELRARGLAAFGIVDRAA